MRRPICHDEARVARLLTTPSDAKLDGYALRRFARLLRRNFTPKVLRSSKTRRFRSRRRSRPHAHDRLS